MKTVGYVFLILGLSLLIFVFIGFLKNQNKIHSPVPENKGIKVIQITPEK